MGSVKVELPVAVGVFERVLVGLGDLERERVGDAVGQ
jgi:hypothetical protein